MRNNGGQQAWRHEPKCEEQDECAQDLLGNTKSSHSSINIKLWKWNAALKYVHVFQSNQTRCHIKFISSVFAFRGYWVIDLLTFFITTSSATGKVWICSHSVIICITSTGGWFHFYIFLLTLKLNFQFCKCHWTYWKGQSWINEMGLKQTVTDFSNVQSSGSTVHDQVIISFNNNIKKILYEYCTEPFPREAAWMHPYQMPKPGIKTGSFLLPPQLQLLTLSLREIPAITLSKPVLAAWILDLVLFWTMLQDIWAPSHEEKTHSLPRVGSPPVTRWDPCRQIWRCFSSSQLLHT